MTRLTRSSYVKIALIVLLALMLFAVAGVGSMRGCSQGIYFGGGTEMGNASVDANSVRNLSVSWAAGSVDISVVDDGAGDVIELVETAPTGLTKAQQMRWSVSGGTLKVDYGSWWSCFALGQKRLEVRIPERYAQSLGAVTVDGASGYYRVAGIGCDTLRFKLASGEIDADGLAAASLDVDVASGQVSVALPADTGFTAKVSKASGSFSSAFETVQQGGSYVHGDGSTAVHVNLASGDFRVEKS